jgi:isoquinoline 1-oxidoreductase subunit beta
MSARLSRRSFLKTGAASGVALVIGFRLHGKALADTPNEKKTPNPFDAWIHLDSTGGVTLLVAKSEMGQGILTALPMVLADELDVDWARVKVEQAPTNPSLYDHGTGGSGSTRSSWLPLRQAGAAAREMLVQAAARQWQVNPNTCKTEAGYVVHGPRRKRLAYGELVAAASKLPVPAFATVALKNPDEFRIVGKSTPRVDVPGKVDGSAVFGLDVRAPGMLYAVVARCPVFGGKPARFEAAKAKAVSGVRDVFEIPAHGASHSAGGIAVVADSTWAAIKGREALQVEWDRGPHGDESTESLRQQLASLCGEAGKAVRNQGDALAALQGAPTVIEAEYELPFQAHATMEPMNCTVQVGPQRAEAWVPTQGPDWAQDTIKDVTKLPADAITVHTTLMGGGFGRRYQADFVAEAAQVAKEAKGAPVKLVWTREDDMQHCFYRPASLHRLRASLDAQGQPSAWLHRMASTSIDAFWSPEKGKPEGSEIEGAVNLPYAIPHVRMEYSPAKSGVPVAWWRSVEHSVNGFVVESFVDEVAAAAKLDPLELRRRLLAEPRTIKEPPDSDSALDTRRLKAVLELAAGRAGWGQAPPAGRSRGIACHFSFRSYVSEVAEVSVDKDGRVRVHRVVCAVDCGRAVNPDAVAAQVEGAIVYGLTAALKSRITVAEGRVRESNFDDYAMLRIDEMPEVEVHIVPSSEEPTGIGEPGLPPVAAAVGNAIFAATGKRVRRLPIRPEDLA